jgi:RNA polymerase sigma-70 factor, ECF subfamily
MQGIAGTPGRCREMKFSLRPLASGMFWSLKDSSRREDRFVFHKNQQPPASSSNAELVARAQRGDEKAFEALFNLHKQRVYSLCLRMIKNTAEAEELTQEAFLQVFRKIHTFRGESAFSTWLHRLSVNIVLMRLRKKSVPVTSLEENLPGDELDEPRMEYGAADPALTGSIDRLLLERAIAQLPPGYKRAFVLHDVHGYEHHEIAAMLGSSIGNSKSQLHKARVRLRKLLGETGQESRRLNELQAELV